MRKLFIILLTIYFFNTSLHAYSSDPKEFVTELVNEAINKLSDKRLTEEDKMKFVEKIKIRMTIDLLILVNLGPGSYSSLRIALSVAKGISMAKGLKIYGYKKKNLKEITLKNIEKLIKKNLLENKLIKPIYLS